MKLGVVSDIHSNTAALRATLTALQDHSPDTLACLGDILGIYGDPNETVELVREHFDHAIIGNHDARALPRYDYTPETNTGTAEQNIVSEITDANRDWLSELPCTKTIENGRVTMAHCRPGLDDPTGYSSGDTGIHPREYTSCSLNGGVLLVGHTHTQHAVNLDKFDGKSGLVANPGSVGDDHAKGTAHYAVIDTDAGTATLSKTQYDPAPVIEHVESLPASVTQSTRYGSMRNHRR